MLAAHKMPWKQGITEVEVSLVLDDLSSPDMESASNELTWGKWQLVNRFVDGQNSGTIPTMKVSPHQFFDLYDFLGRAQNNYKPFVMGAESPEDFLDSRDIFLLINEDEFDFPMGFAVYEKWDKGSAFHDSLESRFQVTLEKPIYWLHSLALDEKLVGQSLGSKVTDFLFPRARKIYGDTHDIMLNTADVHQIAPGVRTLEFYLNRGFEVLANYQAPVSEYQKLRDLVPDRTRQEWVAHLRDVFRDRPHEVTFPSQQLI